MNYLFGTTIRITTMINETPQISLHTCINYLKRLKMWITTAQNNNGETIKSRKTAEIRQMHALTQHREMREKSDESLHEN